MLLTFSPSPYPVRPLPFKRLCVILSSICSLRKWVFFQLDGFYWLTFVMAVAASVIANQAMISGTFSIIQQCLVLGCSLRVKIIHTSSKYEGQVYIPEVNYRLMLACIGVTLGFRTTTKIGNGYSNIINLINPPIIHYPPF